MWSYQFLCFVRQCSLFNQWRCFNHNRSSSLRLFIWFPMLFHAILAQAFREHQSLQGYLKEWGLLLSNWRHSYRHLIEHSLIFFIRHCNMCRSPVYNRGFRGIKKTTCRPALSIFDLFQNGRCTATGKSILFVSITDLIKPFHFVARSSLSTNTIRTGASVYLACVVNSEHGTKTLEGRLIAPRG